MDTDFNIKIADFGWSNYFPLDNKKRTTRIILNNNFSPFVPPEICQKTGHNEKMDIWCFGMLIYYIYTGGEFAFNIPAKYTYLSEIQQVEISINIK